MDFRHGISCQMNTTSCHLIDRHAAVPLAPPTPTTHSRAAAHIIISSIVIVIKIVYSDLVFSHVCWQMVVPKKLRRMGGAFRPIKLLLRKPIKLLRQRRASSPEFHFTAFRDCLLSLRVFVKAFSYRYDHRNFSADAILLVDDV
jgi:hypothetical protein